MEEKNKHSLKKAIDNLPKYTPNDQLWDKLSDNLQHVESNTVLHNAIQQLPTHEAPDHIWANIETQLPTTRKRIWLKLLTVAATIALLVGLAWTITQQNFEGEKIRISHTEQEIKPTELVQLHSSTYAQRDSAFKTIVRAQKKSNDEAKLILAELDLLDQSKRRLKSKLSPYDMNKGLQDKLNRIETESQELQQAYLATI